MGKCSCRQGGSVVDAEEPTSAAWSPNACIHMVKAGFEKKYPFSQYVWT